MDISTLPALESSRRRTAIGYALLLCVVVLWTGSSFITNSLFTSMNYNKPFLTTYLCTATFALYLVKPGYQRLRRHYSPEQASLTKNENITDRGAYAPLSRSNSIDATRIAPGSVIGHTNEPPLTVRDTAVIALMFCTVWFAANVTINAALAQTSVSSVTILSSLSGFFTLLLGSLFGIERFNLTRLLAVIASIVGVVLVSMADNEIVPTSVQDGTLSYLLKRDLVPIGDGAKVPKHPIIGDLLAMASAACYAIYTLLLKAKTGDESRISMTLFFGFVGAWNILLFWPILIILHHTGVEPLEWPHNKQVFIFLIINASITFISDMTMMLSMLMTSPLAVTLGLSLTIPLAVVGDILRGTQIGGLTLFCGGALVLGGFVAVGLADAEEKDEEIIEQILGTGASGTEPDQAGTSEEDLANSASGSEARQSER